MLEGHPKCSLLGLQCFFMKINVCLLACAVCQSAYRVKERGDSVPLNTHPELGLFIE